MRSFEPTVVIVCALLLASCTTDAGSAGTLTPEQKKSLHLAGVTAETARNVTMDKEALERIVQRVKSDIMAESPEVFAPGAPSPLTMKLVFTQYDNGAAAQRQERRSVGVVRIDADVLFVDAGGGTVGRTHVATHFGSGGDVGLTTNILNVEADFEMAVARLLR